MERPHLYVYNRARVQHAPSLRYCRQADRLRCTRLECLTARHSSVTYDVTNVRHATSAMLEISAPGPTQYNVYNPVENPNGTIRDANGFDTGSVAYLTLGGMRGTIELNAKSVGLDPGDVHLLRIIPMNGGVAAGEAGDFSAIQEEGVVPADGGEADGVSVNASGSDALLTSARTAAGPEFLSSVERFDLSKLQAAPETLMSESSKSSQVEFSLSPGGIFANDAGFWSSGISCLTIRPSSALHVALLLHDRASRHRNAAVIQTPVPHQYMEPWVRYCQPIDADSRVRSDRFVAGCRRSVSAFYLERRHEYIRYALRHQRSAKKLFPTTH